MSTLTSLKRKFQYGFTLIELLLVIGIIAILASIVIVAINPTKQLGEARDAQRRSDVNTILNGVYQYAIDNNGTVPTEIDTTATEVCGFDVPRESSDAADDCDKISLNELSGTYLVGIPTDPQFSSSTTGGTAYTISKDGSGRVTVTAPLTERVTPDINAQR